MKGEQKMYIKKETPAGLFSWDPERLVYLMNQAGVSIDKMEKQTGISHASMVHYLKKGEMPGVKAIVAMADYFAVPTDYLLGRFSQEEMAEIEKDYGNKFQLLRKLSYDPMVDGVQRVSGHVDDRIAAPWPYCLLDDILVDGVWTEEFTNYQYGRLLDIINQLDERKRMLVLGYYKDGKTLEGLGKEYGLTRERVRQLLRDSLRMLRHPRNMRILTVTDPASADEKVLIKEVCLYKKQIEELQRANADLKEKIRDVKKKIDLLRDTEKQLDALRHVPTLESMLVSDNTDIDSLGFSRRTNNTLRRNNVHTIGDLLNIIYNGNLMCCKRLGRESAEEIITVVAAATGKNAEEMRDIVYHLRTA